MVTRTELEKAKTKVSEMETQIKTTRNKLKEQSSSLKDKKRVKFTPRKLREQRRIYNEQLSKAKNELLAQQSKINKYKKDVLSPAELEIQKREMQERAYKTAKSLIDKGHYHTYLAFVKLRDYKGIKRDEVAIVRNLLKKYAKEKKLSHLNSTPKYVDELGQGVSFDPTVASGNYKKSVELELKNYYDPKTDKRVLQSIDPSIAQQKGYIPIPVKQDNSFNNKKYSFLNIGQQTNIKSPLSDFDKVNKAKNLKDAYYKKYQDLNYVQLKKFENEHSTDGNFNINNLNQNDYRKYQNLILKRNDYAIKTDKAEKDYKQILKDTSKTFSFYNKKVKVPITRLTSPMGYVSEQSNLIIHSIGGGLGEAYGDISSVTGKVKKLGGKTPEAVFDVSEGIARLPTDKEKKPDAFYVQPKEVSRVATPIFKGASYFLPLVGSGIFASEVGEEFSQEDYSPTKFVQKHPFETLLIGGTLLGMGGLKLKKYYSAEAKAERNFNKLKNADQELFAGVELNENGKRILKVISKREANKLRSLTAVNLEVEKVGDKYFLIKNGIGRTSIQKEMRFFSDYGKPLNKDFSFFGDVELLPANYVKKLEGHKKINTKIQNPSSSYITYIEGLTYAKEPKAFKGFGASLVKSENDFSTILSKKINSKVKLRKVKEEPIIDLMTGKTNMKPIYETPNIKVMEFDSMGIIKKVKPKTNLKIKNVLKSDKIKSLEKELLEIENKIENYKLKNRNSLILKTGEASFEKGLKELILKRNDILSKLTKGKRLLSIEKNKIPKKREIEIGGVVTGQIDNLLFSINKAKPKPIVKPLFLNSMIIKNKPTFQRKKVKSFSTFDLTNQNKIQNPFPLLSTKNKPMVKFKQAQKQAQKQKQLQELKQAQMQKSKQAQMVKQAQRNLQKQKQIQKQKQAQKQKQLQELKPFTTFDSLIFNANSKAKMKAIYKKNKPKKYSSTTKSSRKNKKKYLATPTLTQELLGIKLKKPKTSFTGFEIARI